MEWVYNVYMLDKTEQKQYIGQRYIRQGLQAWEAVRLLIGLGEDVAAYHLYAIGNNIIIFGSKSSNDAVVFIFEEGQEA